MPPLPRGATGDGLYRAGTFRTLERDHIVTAIARELSGFLWAALTQ
jgi:hypothetical protein